MKRYINTLSNRRFEPSQWSDKNIGYERLLQVVEYYQKYINDNERFLNEVIYKIKNYEYINKGVIKCDDWSSGKCNAHTIYINGFKFKYKTGTGINCKDGCKMNTRFVDFQGSVLGFAQEKLIIDTLLSLISEAQCINGCDMDDFINDFGYNDSLEHVRIGEQVYRDIKENTKQLKQIINYKTIEEICDIIEL